MQQQDFARVLAAEAVSNFGAMLSRLAIPWLATLTLQATPMQMAGLLVADVLAAALGGLLLAGWVDRHAKRPTLLLCDGLRALLLLGLAGAAWGGQLTMAGLVLASACSGVLTAVFELARSAWVAQAVDTADLPRRNAQMSAAGSLSETLAFASGGWLFQGLGAVWALLVDGLSYLLSALCLRGVRESALAPSPIKQPLGRQLLALWTDARSGLLLVACHDGLRLLAGVEWLLAAGGGLFGTCFMIFVSRDLGFATGPLGTVFAVGGLGALLGAWVAPRLGRRWGPGMAMALGLGAMTLGHACVPLIGAAGAAGLALLVLHQLVGDGGQVLHDIHDRTLRQTLVPAEQLARADAGIRFVGQVATLMAAGAGGWIGQTWGARQALAVAVLLFGLATVRVFAGRRRFQQT